MDKFKVFYFLIAIVIFSINILFAGDARLQIIHNSADPAADTVDVYVNGQLLLDDFSFRSATPFVDVPGNIKLNVGLAPGNSISVNDTVKNFELSFKPGKTYVAVANGVIDPNNFAPNPDAKPINLTLFTRKNIRESGRNQHKTDFVVLHGVSDAPEIDILVVNPGAPHQLTVENEIMDFDDEENTDSGWHRRRLVNNLIYSEFSYYRRLFPRPYLLEITPAQNNSNVLASFSADLSGLGGEAAVVFASGFLNPSANQNGAGFGLFAALPNGMVVEFPMVAPPVQTARLQIIHNAADPAAGMVDIYVNGGLAVDDFAFRGATPFINIPAGVMLDVGVAPGNSTSVDDTLKNFRVMFAGGETYVAIANGVLDPSQFAPNPDGLDIGFTIFAKDMIREMGTATSNVDFIVEHGATDAPTVDVLARGVGQLVDDAAYGDITPYLSVPAQSYILDVTPGNNNSTVVASFQADLSGLGGGAAVVFASGFLNPSANQNGAGFGLFAALPNGMVVEFPMVAPPVQTARLQIIHNAADPAAGMVDIYVNGGLAVDDFAFRGATPFINIPAGVMLDVGVAPGNSTSVDDTLKNFRVMFAGGETYVAIANGVLDPSQFAPNPDGLDIGFTIFAKDMIREAGTSTSQVDFIVEHGSTDAPTVDVLARGVGQLVDDAAYGDITPYLSVPAQYYILDVTPGNNNSTVVASFQADLSGLGGGAAVVFASGFLNPSANQNGAGFGLFAALPNGMVVEFPMVAPPVQTARLQIIHNAADPAAGMVDIYVNGGLAVDDFAFRGATPFINIPAGVMLDVGVAPGNSTSVDDTLKNFRVMFAGGETYVAIANGVLDPSQFAPNPDGLDIGFTIFAKDMIREMGTATSNVDFIVEHGSTDAPTVDVLARGVGQLVDDAAYGDITPYLSVPAQYYILDVTPGNNNSTVVASFEADLSGLGGRAAVVFASGFLNPSANQNGAAFGLFAALPNGLVVEFPMLPPPLPLARLQIIHNAADPAAGVVDIYVNGGLAVDDFVFRGATPYIDIPAATPLDIGVAPGSSTSVDDTLKNFPVIFAPGRTYVAIANGVLDPTQFAPNPDGLDIGFTIFTKDNAREQANNPNKVDVFAVHGATDAPAVSIIGLGIFLRNVSYGDISDYFSLPAWYNWLVVYTPFPNFSLVGVYNADLSGLDGQSAVVFASGFLDPSANQGGSAFGIFAAFVDGTVVELPQIFGNDAQQILAQIDAPDFDKVASLQSVQLVTKFQLEQNYPNPFNPTTRISFSLPSRELVTLRIYDITGREIATLLNDITEPGIYDLTFDAAGLPSGMYFYRINAGAYNEIRKMMLVK